MAPKVPSGYLKNRKYMVILTEKQLDTINNISPRGFHINEGMPCECGGDAYSTSKEHGYSDFLTYHHTCGKCGNEFSTYIEG